MRALADCVHTAAPRARPVIGRRVAVVALRPVADEMARLLIGAGASTRIATSVPEALEVAREMRPHVVLIDVSGGFEATTLLARLREVAGPLPMGIALFSSQGDGAAPLADYGADAVLMRGETDTLASIAACAARLFA